MNQNISLYQFSVLIILSIMGISILFCPEIIFAGRAGWFADFTGIVFSTISAFFLIILYRFFPKKNLPSVIETLSGRLFAILMSLIFFIYALMTGVVILRTVGEFLNTSILPGMSLLLLTFLFAASAAYAVFSGIETIGRTAQVIFPFVIFIFLLLPLLTLPDLEIKKLLPLSATFQQKNIIKATFSIWGFPLGDLILLNFLFPYIKKDRKEKQTAKSPDTKRLAGYLFISVLIGGTILLIRTLLLILVFGPELSSVFAYPVFSLVGTIQIGDFLERLEPAFLSMWLGTAFVKFTISYWIAVEIACYIGETKSNKEFVLPVGIIMILLTGLLYKNFGEQKIFLFKTWPVITIFFNLFIPAIFLLLSFLSFKIINFRK